MPTRGFLQVDRNTAFVGIPVKEVLRICARAESPTSRIAYFRAFYLDHISTQPGEGLGLANAKERLAELYGDAASLEVGGAGSDTQGTLVTLRFPSLAATPLASAPDPS